MTQELRKRLNNELDIIQLIKSARYSRVLSKIKLKKLQRILIGSFKNYVINYNKPYRAERVKAKLLKKSKLDFSNFDPASDLIDQMILYQTTGHRMPGTDYPFTLSENEIRRNNQRTKKKIL